MGVSFFVVVYRYWIEGKETWPRMLPIVSTVGKVLGSGAFEAYGLSELTVLDAMRMEELTMLDAMSLSSLIQVVTFYLIEGRPIFDQLKTWPPKSTTIRLN